MATLYVWQAYELSVDGEQLVGGSRSSPTSITVDGKRKEWYRSLATATTVTVWDGTDANEALSNFDFLYIESDQLLIVEFTTDVGNENGDEKYAIEVQANQPQMLLSDDACAAYTSIASFTADVIDKIQVRNNSGSTANVRVLLIT